MAGGCWWGWQTKTLGDPLGPRPDQFRPIHFDLLHLSDFCAFNDLDAKNCIASHANTLIGIEYNLVTLSQYICYCAWLCLNDFRGRKALPGHLGGTLRGQSDSDANIVIYYLIKQLNIVT